MVLQGDRRGNGSSHNSHEGTHLVIGLPRDQLQRLLLGDSHFGIALKSGLEEDGQQLLQVLRLTEAVLDGVRRLLDRLAHVSGNVLLDPRKLLSQIIDLRVESLHVFGGLLGLAMQIVHTFLEFVFDTVGQLGDDLGKSLEK